MRAGLAVLLATVLAACAVGERPAGSGRGLVATSGSKGTLHCERKGSGGDPEADWASCTDIPVIVLFNGTQCSVLIPYDTLWVHGRKDKTTVQWNLVAPKGYVIRNVPLAAALETKARVEEAWEPPIATAAPGPTFRWELKKGAPMADFNHDVIVTNAVGTVCGSIDPIIHNDAN